MEKTTINFRNLDAVGACNRRKQFDGVRLTTDASLQMEQALITKQMVILALAARAVRGLADPDVLQDMLSRMSASSDSAISSEPSVARSTACSGPNDGPS